VLRGLLGSLLWILAALLGLLGVLLSITIILLPVGVPLLLLARRLFRYSMTLFLPRKVRHPVQELSGSARDLAGKVPKPELDLGSARKSASKTTKRTKKRMKRQWKRLPV
jgi:hypothetical protein